MSMRLLCLAHAGGGPSAFRAWRPAIPDSLDITSVPLPGREGLYTEPQPHDLATLVQDILERGASWFEGPYALFGHSMGALLAFELARAVRREGLRLPQR